MQNCLLLLMKITNLRVIRRNKLDQAKKSASYTSNTANTTDTSIAKSNKKERILHVGVKKNNLIS